MKKKLFLSTAVFLVISLTGYFFISKKNGAYTPPANPKKIQIVTSFYPLYFFASQIAGDKADVYNITPSGTEPHDYEPTARDMARIEDSQLLILNGRNLEAWGDKIQATLNGSDSAVMSMDKIPDIQNFRYDDATIYDPHFWLDPFLIKSMADAIVTELDRIDPTNTIYYEENHSSLLAKLDELDNKFARELTNCQKKDIITSHAAFNYTAHRYGFNQVSISGLSPDEEPSLKKLAEVSAYAKKNNIKYIFFESLVSPKLAETIAQEVDAQTLVLNPIEGLSAEEIKNGKNYFTEMEQNLINLKIALECK